MNAADEMTGREPFLSAAARLLRESGCTVVKWRTGTSGLAYTDSADWDIEVPPPRGPVSFGVFAHEVAHQLLHRTGPYRPRWREELEAWEYALAQFPRLGVPGVEKARADAAKSLRHAASKAARGGSPKAARAILAAYPAWVWVYDDPRSAVVESLFEELHRAAA